MYALGKQHSKEPLCKIIDFLFPTAIWDPAEEAKRARKRTQIKKDLASGSCNKLVARYHFEDRFFKNNDPNGKLDHPKIRKLKSNMTPLLRSSAQILELVCFSDTQTPTSRRQETAKKRITEALSIGSSPESGDTKVVMNALRKMELEKVEGAKLDLTEQFIE
jgi:hypothetical protein